MKKDRVYAKKQAFVSPFTFSAEVAEVFDDMLVRSVPFYGEALKQQARMARHHFREGTRIYDLGCSHGNMGLVLLETFGTTPFSMTAVDNSWPMVNKYSQRLSALKPSARIDLVCGAMEDIRIQNASVVIINLTLQFLDPAKRDDLIRTVCQGLLPGGVLLITEKTRHQDPALAELEETFYRQFKRENGYSDLEISQKRDALEKVLIPESVACHRERILRAGFSRFHVWLRWFNFASMLAVK